MGGAAEALALPILTEFRAQLGSEGLAGRMLRQDRREARGRRVVVDVLVRVGAHLAVQWDQLGVEGERRLSATISLAS